MLFRLIVLSPPMAGRQITMEKAPMVIGSAPDCDIRIEDEEMFARHAVLEHREDGLYIRDIGSTGTILVNRREVKESRLKHSDEIEIGRTRFLVQARVRAEVDGPAGGAAPRKRRTLPAILAIFVVLAASVAAFHFSAIQPCPSQPASVLSRLLPKAPRLPEFAAPVAPLLTEPGISPEAVNTSAPAIAREPAPAATNEPPPGGGEIQKIREDINGIRQMMQTLVESQATVRLPPPRASAPTSSPPPSVAPGWIRISSIEATKFPRTESYREIRTFAITLLQTAAADLRDRPVRVETSFFDKDPATGQVTPSKALAPRGPLEIRDPWAPGQQKTVTATYTLPPGDGKTSAGPEFHGYIVRVFCAGVLQDQKARPPDLLDLSKATKKKE